MYFSGIADESGKDIHTQIKAHKELGWDHIELRLVDGEGIALMSDEKFGAVAEAVTEAGMQVSCFSAAIANWSRPITGSPDQDYAELRRAIPRMNRLGTDFIRVMSYPNDRDNPVSEDAWRDEAIVRLRELARIAEDGGVILVHENCSGWGGESAAKNNVLLHEVNSPALKVVFDTGNPVTYGQNAWDFYKEVYPHIVYVHIKDAKAGDDGECDYCYPGEGDGYVREIMADILGNGYDGGISIEPHLAAVIHTGEEAASAEVMYTRYTEYGHRLMKLVDETIAASAER